ncbi:amidase signature domain-containing protein [Rutstroemia sp. NJR-2017a WRK4]|nr:amidase signature domain-containing protein [Rutstroemia sp. NJR-2017a WRK4]
MKYADLLKRAPIVMPAFSPNYIASVLGLPQVVVPIGQIPFESRISKRTEYLPTVGSIAGAPGKILRKTSSDMGMK